MKIMHQQGHSHPINLASKSSASSGTSRFPPESRQKLDVKLRPPDPMQLSHAEDLSVKMSSDSRGPRTVDDFLLFCDVVLKYANYPNAFVQEDEIERHDIKAESPLNSVGESAQGSTHSSSESISSNNGEGEHERGAGDFTDEDSWGQITCWCGKPFAGRPMIECEGCFVWLHLTCARVRKSNIPEHFMCSRCKPPKTRRKRQISGSDGDGDSPGTSNSVINLPGKGSGFSHGQQNHANAVMSSGSSNTQNLHTDFARSASLKSHPYYTHTNNGGGPSYTQKTKRFVKPRPRRPAIASATTNSFENPTLLPLRLTITTSHNPPPFS